jgi:post-segregation antitoxin (ccd killing protein)
LAGSYVTVSAKIKRELKEEAERLGVDFSEVIRKAIEEEVRRRKIMMIERELEELSSVLEKISVDDIVEAIREMRRAR